MQRRYLRFEVMENTCYCGHDCARCYTYLAANDADMRDRAADFYKAEFGYDVPPEDIRCQGGRTENIFKLCAGCPFRTCCREQGIAACTECSRYPCEQLAEYQQRYVNKVGQVKGTRE